MKFIEILEVFNARITEEQAWAVLYQTSKDLLDQWNISKTRYPLPQLNSINFKDDGTISVSSENGCDELLETLQMLAESVYYALSFGGDSGVGISKSLSAMLIHMAQLEPDDEGYNADDDDPEDCTLAHVMRVCAKRLTNSNNVEHHYSAVTRSFLTEARLLMSFLHSVEENTKIANRNNNNNDDSMHDIPQLEFAEWTKHWVLVVEGLRNGVTTLRKVEQSQQNPVAYELTPYEILMQDIRKQKYTLKKVSQIELNNKPSPTNPHDVILDFIRGRPSLNPMENRILRSPPPRSKSLHERLIEQIHACEVPLKHVPLPDDSVIRRSRTNTDVSRSRPTSVILPLTTKTNPTHRRKLTASTIDLLYSSSSDEDSEDESPLSISTSASDQSQLAENNKSFNKDTKINHYTTRSNGNIVRSSDHFEKREDDRSKFASPPRGHSTRTAFRRKKSERNLVPINTQAPSNVPNVAPEKPSLINRIIRPTVGIRRVQSMAVRSPSDDKPSTLEQKRAEWRLRRQKDRQSTTELPTEPKRVERDDELDKLPPKQTKKGTLKRSVSMKPKIRSPIPNFTPTQMQDACPTHPSRKREDLTVNELMHIREVLARAELEKYLKDGELYSNLKKGKVCFTCQVRKFSFFNWSNTCQICKQKICSKCTRTARAPSEHYLQSPVSSLSLINSRTADDGDKNKSFLDEDTIASEIQNVLSAKWRKILSCVDCYDLLHNMLATGPTILPNITKSYNNSGSKPPRYRSSTVSEILSNKKCLPMTATCT